MRTLSSLQENASRRLRPTAVSSSRIATCHVTSRLLARRSPDDHPHVDLSRAAAALSAAFAAMWPQEVPRIRQSSAKAVCVDRSNSGLRFRGANECKRAIVSAKTPTGVRARLVQVGILEATGEWPVNCKRVSLAVLLEQ